MPTYGQPIYDNPSDANLSWSDFLLKNPWAAGNPNVAGFTGGNGTQAQGGRAGMAGGVDPWASNPNNPQNPNSPLYQGGMGGAWNREAQQNPNAVTAEQRARQAAAARSAQYQNNPGYQALQWQQNQWQQGRAGNPANATDYNSLMNGLNSLNPGDINIDSTASMFTNAALSQYGQNSADQLKYLQQAGQAGIRGYQGILGTLQGGVADYLKNINQGAQAELGGIQGTLGYYQSLANRNQLPGQNIMEQNMQGGTANALNRVREFGGSSQGALGAITNLYGQQQQGMRDIGMGAAQYQAQNQQNLAGYMGTVGGQRAGVYNRMGEAGLAGAQVNAQGQQMLTQAQQSAAGDVSNYYGNQATQGSQFLQSLMQQRLAAEQQQADLQRRSILDVASTVGSGIQAETDASNLNYMNNQVLPYTNYANYFNAMMGNQVDPNGAAGIAGQMYNTNNQWAMMNRAGWSNAANSFGNLAGNVAGYWMTNGGYGGRNQQTGGGGYWNNGTYIGE